MNKKLRIAVAMIILAFSFGVKAEVFIDIDCDDTKISSNKNVTCEVDLYYGTEGINDIEFNYDSNLDMKISNNSSFTMNNSNNKISIHTDTPLYDQILNFTKLFEVTLSVNDKTSEKENFTISNIVINKNNEIKLDNISKEFNVTIETIKLDNNCNLDSITVDNEKVKNFNKDILEYREIFVTKEIVYIDAVRSSEKSMATGLGNVKVPNGKTVERDITVTAEDKKIKVYKLFITNTNKEVIKSSDNTLKSLEIYNGNDKIDIDFNINKTIYDIEINDKVDKLTIKAELNDSKASFINKIPRDIIIKYGINKELIKIKAENNDERVITLNINYIDNRNKDTSISSLIINGRMVDLTSDKLEIILPNNNLKTEIEVIPNNDKEIIKYEDILLNVGNNDVAILVTSEYGETKEYHVNVIREEIILPDKPITIITNARTGNKIINIICYIFFGISVITLISSSIYSIKNRRN